MTGVTAILFSDLPTRGAGGNHDEAFAGRPEDVPCLSELRDSWPALLETLRGRPGEPANRKLVLLYALGLADLIGAVKGIWQVQRRSEVIGLKTRLCGQHPPLEFAREVGDLIEGLDPEGHLRVITPIDLVDLFAEIHPPGDLARFLVGADGLMGYDTPKIVDSVVRLRHIGCGIPTFRLDYDVLVPAGAALRSAVSQMEDWVELHRANTTIPATMLSADYERPANSRALQFDEAATGYATRPHPAMLVPVAADHTVFDHSAAEHCFSQHSAAEYYDRVLPNIGAPATGVISGALEYLSDACVLSIPPFSNFTSLVMWIDDHIRYSTHRELGDFPPSTIRATEADGSQISLVAKNDRARLRKNRTQSIDWHLWIVTGYLPTLLYGCIMNDWITDPRGNILKSRLHDLSDEDQEKWRAAKAADADGEFRGPLARAIYHARLGSDFPSERDLLGGLYRSMDQTVWRFAEAFENLVGEDGRATFGSAWATGEWPQDAPPELLELEGNILGGRSLREVERNHPALYEKLEQLVQDAVHYVEWCREWPAYTQTINALPHGHFRSDVGWTA